MELVKVSRRSAARGLDADRSGMRRTVPDGSRLNVSAVKSGLLLC